MDVGICHQIQVEWPWSQERHSLQCKQPAAALVNPQCMQLGGWNSFKCIQGSLSLQHQSVQFPWERQKLHPSIGERVEMLTMSGNRDGPQTQGIGRNATQYQAYEVVCILTSDWIFPMVMNTRCISSSPMWRIMVRQNHDQYDGGTFGELILKQVRQQYNNYCQQLPGCAVLSFLWNFHHTLCMKHTW